MGKNCLGSGDTNDLNFLRSVVNWTDLEMLGLSQNSFGGVLPNAIANLSANLKSLDLQFNIISGRLPVGMLWVT